MKEKDIMATLNKHGIKERDPSKWKILKTGDGEDPKITFQAGTYTNRRGMEIPVIFHCHKSGIIYRLWLQEMERRKRGGGRETPAREGRGRTENVIELKEGEVIEIRDRPIEEDESPWARYKSPERLKEQVDLLETPDSKGRKLLELEDKKELAGMQWRLEGLRSQLRSLPYCDHEKDICTGECKVREEIRELERKCLRDP